MNLGDYISAFKRRPERLGMDVNTRSVRVVRLGHTSDGELDVVSYGTFEIALKRTTPIEMQKFHVFLKQISGGVNRVAVNIEDTSLRIRKMNFPKMPQRDLMEAIRWNFREHIEGPIEEYAVGYTEIRGWDSGDQLSYSAFGVSEKAIENHSEMVKLVGLKPVSIEPCATALLAAFNENIVWAPRQLIVCITITESHSYFTVMSDGQLLFSRLMSSVSLEVLTKKISRELTLEESVAEKLLSTCLAKGEVKFIKPDAAEVEEVDLSEIMAAFFSQLVVETQRSIDAFCLMFGVDHVNAIYLCGIGADFPGISEHMKKTLGIPTEIFYPFAKAKNKNITAEIKQRSSVYAIAYGLAIP